MSEVDMELVVSSLQDRFDRAKHVDVMWYGGEPLMALDTIESLTNKIRSHLSKGQIYTARIVTNGYLLTKDVALRLRECGVRQVQITLDGDKSVHDSRRALRNGAGSFDTIIRNISGVWQILPIVIRINVDKSNIDSIPPLLDKLTSMGLQENVHVYIAPVDDCGSSVRGFDCMSMEEFASAEIAFYKLAIQYGFGTQSLVWAFDRSVCGAICKNSFVVDPSGAVYKCWDDVCNTAQSVGNLRIGVLENSEKAKPWLTYSVEFDGCKDCPVFPICLGGCPKYPIRQQKRRCSSVLHNFKDRTAIVFEQMRQLKNS